VRLIRVRILFPALALVVLPWLSAQRAVAQGGQLRTVSPLPVSDYSVRSVCAAPVPGHASCLALELVPKTPAARAHTHPVGMPRPAPIRAGKVAEVCKPPTAAEGCYGLRPQDLHSAYVLPTAAPSEQKIALVDAYDDPTAEADLKVYDEAFHLPSCTSANGCFTKVNGKGKTSPLPVVEGGWALEISLDVEVAHAICQSCHILLVEASDDTNVSLDAAEETAVRLGASEISNSWATAEPATDSAVFNHPGIAITAAAGDYGYLNWDTPYPEERGLISYPASSPHVIAVGGTRLSLTAEGGWAGETVWNGGAHTLVVSRGAGGGGCSSRFPAPPWQLELPNWSLVGCESRRAVADVSADADPYTGVAVYDSTPVPVEEGFETLDWAPIGGTSLASPLIAATFALAGGPAGIEYPASTLYESRVAHPGALHDIQSGSNGECTKAFAPEGLSGCTESEEALSCSGEAICLAGPGYDGPSGVGTPIGIGAFQPGSERKEAQTITFTSSAPAQATVGGATYTVSATASSGLPVLLSSGAPSLCSVEESTVSFIGAGTCTIDANQPGDRRYSPAPVIQQSFAVGPSPQLLEFTSTAPSAATVDGASYVVSAVASSGLPVLLSSGAPSVCSVEESTVSFIGAGTCTIDANQPGDSSYEFAPEVRQSFAVGAGSQLIRFTSTPPDVPTVGGPTYPVSASASSGLPVLLSSGTPSVCSVEGSTVSFGGGAGTCTIDANQPGNPNYDAAPQVLQSFAVGKDLQLITFTSPAPTSATVGVLPYTVSAATSSGLVVSFSSGTPFICSIVGSAVSFVAAGTCTIDASQEGSAEYEAAPEAEQSFVVGRRSQVVAFTSSLPASATVAGFGYAVSADASSGLPVSFVSGTPSVCALAESTVSFVGAGTCTIDADQPGNAEYSAAPRAQQSFGVGPTPTLTSLPSLGTSFLPVPTLTSPSTTSTRAQAGSFSLVGNPTVNTRTGAITFTVSIADPGAVSWLLTFRNGGSGAFSASGTRCTRGQVKLNGECRPVEIVFGKGGTEVATARMMSFTVRPSRPARTALANARARGRGLTVLAVLTFRFSLGGSPVSDASRIKLELKKTSKDT
jgi:Subtilase family